MLSALSRALAASGMLTSTGAGKSRRCFCVRCVSVASATNTRTSASAFWRAIADALGGDALVGERVVALALRGSEVHQRVVDDLRRQVGLGGAGAGAYFLGFFGGESSEHAEAEDTKDEAEKTVFYEVPEILVNLNSTGRKETYLKIRISLELENAEAQAAIEPLMPRVIDSFQVFLREMRVEDISGSAGMIRLKEEMLQRINLSVAPLKVKDVLFKEMLIQ